MKVDEAIVKSLSELSPKDILELINVAGVTCITAKLTKNEKMLLAIAMMDNAIVLFESIGGSLFVSASHSKLNIPIEYITGEDCCFGEDIGY